jgi:hypothetical protein
VVQGRMVPDVPTLMEAEIPVQIYGLMNNFETIK